MQEHNVGQPPPQLLRESYLAEARAQQRHSAMSRSDSGGSRRLVYGGLKGQAEEPGGRDEPQGPDLSAFLSQEELDESVNLACQAIGHKSREDKAATTAMALVVEKAPGMAAPPEPPPSPDVPSGPSSCSFTLPPSASSSFSFSVPPSAATFSSSSFSTLPPAAPSVLAYPTPSFPPGAPQSAPGRREPAQAAPAAFGIDAPSESDPAPPAVGMSHGKLPCEGPSGDPERSSRGPQAPYGAENQSKKEFLNKAADFIEELSSLFKANSSKRGRPRSCKTHKSRTLNRSQGDGLSYGLGPGDRDRPVQAPHFEEEVAESRQSPAAAVTSYQPEAAAERALLPQHDSLAAGTQWTQCDPPSQQVEQKQEEEEEKEVGQQQQQEEPQQEEEEAGILATPPYSEEPVCEPPCFIQKLKSREVLEGSKVQLDCSVTGRPAPEVRWFCEGKELENSPDIQILQRGERHSLTIAEAFEEDTGRYSCFASNFYGTDSTSAEIYVEGASSTDSEGEQIYEHVTHQVQRAQKTPKHQAPPPPLAAPPAGSTTEYDSDSSSQITVITSTAATAGDDPPPHQHPPVGAQGDETPLQPAAPPPPAPGFPSSAAPQFLDEEPAEGPPTTVRSRVDVLLPEAPEEPAPEPLPGPGPGPGLGFQPLAQEDAPPDVNGLEAPVHVAPTQCTTVENSSLQSHQEPELRPIMAAPVFTKSLQEVIAAEGQLVVLECRMKGVPSPRVEWYREGTFIEDSPDFRILQKKPRSPSESEAICTLVIAEVFPEDSGMFTCTASNKYGTVSSFGALRVRGNNRVSSTATALRSAPLESGQVQESFLSEGPAPAVTRQPEVTVTTAVKPHSSSLRLDPLSSSSLRLDPLSSSTLRLDPLSSSTLRLDPLSSSTLRLDPLSSSTLRLDPLNSSSLRLDPLSSSSLRLDPLSSSSLRLDPLSSSSLRLDPVSSSTLRLDPLSSSSLRLDPVSSSTLRLDPLSSSSLRLDPLSSSMLRSDSPSVSLPSLDPQALSSSSRERTSYTSTTPCLDPHSLISQRPNAPGSGETVPEPRSVDSGASFYLKPFGGSSATAAEPQTSSLEAEQETPKNPPVPPASADPDPEPPKARGGPGVMPLPDPPANSCLKTSALSNHRESRSGAKAGLRVTFRLPEDEDEEPCEPSGWPYEDADLGGSRGPPPVLTKPKLDPAQLQLLHNQVLLEQQQDGDSHSHSKSRPMSPPWTQAPPQPQPPPPAQSLTQSQPAPHTQSLTQVLPQGRSQYQPAPPARPPGQSQPQVQSQYQPPAYTLSLTQTQPPPQTQTQTQNQSQYQPPAYTQSLTQPQPPPPQSQALPQSHPQVPAPDSVVWSPRLPREPFQQQVQLHANAPATTQSHVPVSSSTMAPTMPTLSLGSAPVFLTTQPSQSTGVPAAGTSRPSPPQLKTALQSTASPASLYSPPPAATITQMSTLHASHLNLSLAAQSKSTSSLTTQFSSPPAPQFHASSATEASRSGLLASSLQEVMSPTPMLRSTHASLMSLSATSQSFSYARPKEFIPSAAAPPPFSPVRSPSPTESPVPLLNELAAELNSSAASSPTLPPFSPPPPVRQFPTRVLQSPTSPLSAMSPTLTAAPFLNSVFAGRAQSPPQASSPASSSSTPSPIQNPVAFLSSVLPSLHIAQATNAMGLPKSAPAGQLKRLPKSRTQSAEDIRASKETILNDIERRLRQNDDSLHFGFQQKLNNVGKTASRTPGPIIPATVFNYDEEYKVSNFEQRLMSEIEFRLERTPVEESDDEVHHDAVPTGRCIAPIFDKKLKNFRAVEGVPVTFSCKLVGIPVPKVYWFKDGKQILRANSHYRKIREGDGTCALHIDCTTNDDDGNYTVMAANPQGRISCSGHLIIQTGASRNRMTPIHSQRVRTRIQEVEEGEPTQERFFRPHFLQAPGDMVAHEGRLCRLECKVSGLPSPELMWLVNGKPIYPDIFHRMLVRENGVHSLVIDPVVQNHAGVYTCIASNKAGQSSFCLDLKVLEKEVKQAPSLVERLQNTGIPEGNPARLECRVAGMPPPAIFWKKDNDTIPRARDRFSMHQDATGYVCLLIQPTRKEDAGWYTVSAKNEAGIVSCTSRLDIYAQWHQSIPTPMQKPARTGSRYAALTGQGLDLKALFPSADSGPILFASSPPESRLESEEL